MAAMVRKKAALYVVFLAVIFIALVLSAGGNEDGFSNTKIRSTDDLSAFLLSLGWECDTSRLTEQSTVLPRQFDETFIAYNAIQLKQNCDLTHYAGKEVTVFTVPILNYTDSNESVLATVIVYRGKVIGGDIHAAAMDGFILPLK